MFDSLPESYEALLDWGWAQFAPYFDDLASRELTAENVGAWLEDLSQLGLLIRELSARLYVATTVDTTDDAAKQRYFNFLENIYPKLQAAENPLNKKILDSGLQPEGFEIGLKHIAVEVDLFREANLPLIAQDAKMTTEYNALVGAQTVEWDGEEVTLLQLRKVYHDPDRSTRERAWKLELGRWLHDRESLNDLWTRCMDIRGQIAANADLPDYRGYKWRELKRLDYTPEDCETFADAIAEAVVPAAQRIYDKRRARLGLATLRPWDLEVEIGDQPPLQPFDDVADLERTINAMFDKVDPKLGGYFKSMREQALLDLGNRKGKAPGGYCIYFAYANQSFIFMNSVGLHRDVQTMLHEGGHAFHNYEAAGRPFNMLQRPPMEFNEVASMAMELLGAPYLTAAQGGFYTEAEAARARIEHLEKNITFWPYMAVVDLFQQWAYTHHKAASDPANCDAKWAELWDRFMPGIDYAGLEDEKATGWHRKQHIFRRPFYYVEYGLAQLGAVQVWARALEDQAEAVKNYRKALALGGSATIPQLYATAGAKFAFDSATMAEAVALMERTINDLETV